MNWEIQGSKIYKELFYRVLDKEGVVRINVNEKLLKFCMQCKSQKSL